jgi:glycosyltransferase involved in cell wall biosynthesis
VGLLAHIAEISMPEPDTDKLWGRYIDFPVEASQTEAFAFDIIGWVLSKESRPIAVEVTSNGELLRRVPFNFRRPDLAEGFPHVPKADQGGFRTTLSLLGPKADFELQVDAVLRNKSRIAVGTIRGSRCWRLSADPSIARLVSVIVPCCNQAHFLPEAIESVFAQTYPHFEVVVVDDGSQDNIPEVVARYAGVRYVSQENKGLSAARNTGIRKSNGDFLVFLDADDRLLPEALEAGLRHFDERPACAFVSGECRHIASDGAPLPRSPSPCDASDYYRALLRGNCISMPAAVMYRRSVFEFVRGFDTSMSAAEDHDLYLRVARNFPIHCHRAEVAEYRLHGSNMSRDAEVMLRAAVAVLRSQRKHVRERKEYRKAYRAGLRSTREFYGDQVVIDARLHLSERRWRQAISSIAALVRYYQRGLASLARPAFLR